jgi:serine/threonine-protein kinase
VTELALICDGEVIRFPSRRFTLGSANDCELRLYGCEPHHAQVLQEDDGSWSIRDIAGSGTLVVDGHKTLEARIDAGSSFSLGEVVFHVRDAAAGPDDDGGLGKTQTPVEGGGKRPRAGPLPNGTIIEKRYRVLEKLAAGGMGEVYRAEHIELMKPVAVKVMLPDLSRDAEFVARFKREAVAASRIGAPNIVDISDFGRTEDGRFYFVMELLDGRTLASHVKDGPFSTRRVAHVGLQIARALAAAHDKGIVHRDLKPDNVMLLQRPGQPDFAKVLDFGIAKVSAGGTGHTHAGLTQIGTVVGTPQYMSPEQASGLPVDARTDVYSLGLILYELIAGRPTFKGETPSVLMAMQMTSEPAPLEPGPVDRPVAPELEQLVFHLLKKRVHQRPQTMQEVIERLEHVLANATTDRRPAIVGPPRTREDVATKPEAPSAIRSARGLGPVPAPATRGQVSTQPEAPSDLPTDPIVKPYIVTTHSSPAIPGDLPTDPVVGAYNTATPLPHDTRHDVPAAGTPTTATPATATSAPARSNAPLLIGALFVLALGGTAAGLWWVNREPPKVISVVALTPTPPSPTPPPQKDPPAEAPKPAPVKLRFETQPANAEVFEDDVLLGTAPLTLSRPPGQVVSLRFELKGFKGQARKVRFETDDTVEISLDPAPAPKKGPGKSGLHDDPYGNGKDLKDLPD